MVLKPKWIEFYTLKKKGSSDEEIGNVRKLEQPAEEKNFSNWGIKVIRNTKDYQCNRIVNLDDIKLIKETDKFANTAQLIDMKKMLDIFAINKKEENANQKNFVFKMKCEKLSTTDSKPHTVFVMS